MFALGVPPCCLFWSFLKFGCPGRLLPCFSSRSFRFSSFDFFFGRVDWLSASKSILPVTLIFDSNLGVLNRNNSLSFLSADVVDEPDPTGWLFSSFGATISGCFSSAFSLFTIFIFTSSFSFCCSTFSTAGTTFSSCWTTGSGSLSTEAEAETASGMISSFFSGSKLMWPFITIFGRNSSGTSVFISWGCSSFTTAAVLFLLCICEASRLISASGIFFPNSFTSKAYCSSLNRVFGLDSTSG